MIIASTGRIVGCKHVKFINITNIYKQIQTCKLRSFYEFSWFLNRSNPGAIWKIASMKVAWWRTWPGRVWPFHSLRCIAMIWITIENPPTRDFPELPVEVKIVWLHAFKYLVGILHLKLRSWHLHHTLAKSGTTSSSSMYFNRWMPEIILANFNYRWGCAYGATYYYMLNSMEKIDRNFVIPNPRNFVLKPTLSQDSLRFCNVQFGTSSTTCFAPQISGQVDRLSTLWELRGFGWGDGLHGRTTLSNEVWQRSDGGCSLCDELKVVQMHYGHLWPPAHGTEGNW